MHRSGFTPQYDGLEVLWEKDAQPVNDIARRRFRMLDDILEQLKI